MKNLTILFLFMLAVISCQKDSETFPENFTVTMNESGTLSIKIIDSDGGPVEGAILSVLSSIPESEEIYYDTTDASGTCNIGKVLQGQYRYYVSTEKNGMTYGEREYFQVIAGDAKYIEVNPFLNVGDISVEIVDYYGDSIPNVNVALIPHPSYYGTSYTFQSLIDESYFVRTTDSHGWVNFKNVPAGDPYTIEYSVMAFYSSNDYDYPYRVICYMLLEIPKMNIRLKLNYKPA